MSTKNNIHVLSRGVIIDQDHILLCKTLDLPISFYFLPGGHVEHGESVDPQDVYDETPLLSISHPNLLELDVSKLSSEDSAQAIMNHIKSL